MKLNEVLKKVWKAIDKIENIDFDQTGEDIKEELLGIHRQFRSQDGVMDKVQDCLQELQEVVDEYKSIEDELGINLITLFKALKNGVYSNHYAYAGEEIHKIDVELEKRPYGFCVYGGFGEGHNLKDYGKTWALTKEELL